jgi:hypothetical protein
MRIASLYQARTKSVCATLLAPLKRSYQCKQERVIRLDAIIQVEGSAARFTSRIAHCIRNTRSSYASVLHLFYENSSCVKVGGLRGLDVRSTSNFSIPTQNQGDIQNTLSAMDYTWVSDLVPNADVIQEDHIS